MPVQNVSETIPGMPRFSRKMPENVGFQKKVMPKRIFCIFCIAIMQIPHYVTVTVDLRPDGGSRVLCKRETAKALGRAFGFQQRCSNAASLAIDGKARKASRIL
jgi:hypothetical protein